MLPLVDHHCHGVTREALDRAGFEAFISEGGPPAPGATNFDTPVGLAIRRHCAPVLDLPVHAPPLDYLARRTELGVAEVTRRLLTASGTQRFCIDTGFHPAGLTTPDELAAFAGGSPGSAREIVRLESVAEALAADGVDAGEFAERFAVALDGTIRSRGAVGVKTIAAYRVGFDLNPVRPASAEIAEAAGRWLRRGPDGERGWRLDDAVLTRYLLWCAVDHGLPIQFHVGFGDADIRMHRVDPSLLTDWLHQHRVPVMLLHCWPYQRRAAFLATVHPHVHLDLGLTLTYVGPARAAAVLAEVLELTPFGKMLYSSDAYGVPELYHLAALAFRRGLAQVLQERVATGEWAAPDAVRVARWIGRGNAVRVYGFESAMQGDPDLDAGGDGDGVVLGDT